MSKITDRIWELAEPVVRGSGCELWDVEYVKEAGGWYLRLYIDKDGGVGIDDCETVSRAFDPILDEEDPIPTSYTFEVSSAGAERQLKRPSDFERFMGSPVEVKLYKPVNGAKVWNGRLARYDGGAVELDIHGNTVRFEKTDIAGVRLRIEF